MATPKKKTAPKKTRPVGNPPLIGTHGEPIIMLVAAGIGIKTACRSVGIHYTTLQSWRHRGEDARALHREGYRVPKTEQTYLDFIDRFDTAQDALLKMVETKIARQVADTNEEPTISELLKIAGRLDRERWGETLTITDDTNVAERFAQALTYIVRSVMDDLGLTTEQREQVPDLVEKYLAITAGTHATRIGA